VKTEINEAKYSILIFKQTVDNSMSDRLLNYIYQGYKVFLFTIDSLEQYEGNPAWIKAKKFGLFYWEEVPFNTRLPADEKMILDGVVTEPSLYKYICENSQFNHQQYEAEHENTDAHIIVSAGAGTGKTTVMIQRLMFILHTTPTISFSEILLITFTNEAAVNLRRKLAARLMDYFKITGQKRYLEWIEESQNLRVSTIHSFAKKFLETAGHELGFPSTLSLRSFRFEKQRIIEKLIDQYSVQYPEEYRAISTIPHYLIVNMVMYVNSVIENNSAHSKKMINNLDFGLESRQMSIFLRFLVRGLHESLDRIKAELYQWEITDLICHFNQLPDLPSIAGKITICYIMVDEFQDTDAVQVQFLLWLYDQLDFRIFVVGDEKQSIYRFRGADYTAFRQLEQGLHQRGKDVQCKYLVKNYRTTDVLLTDMNCLFQQWGKKVVKFRFVNNDILEPTVREDEKDSAGMVLFTTKAKLKEVLTGLVNTDTAILVRSNQDVQNMINWCDDSGFFCEGSIQGDFYRTDPVREFYIMIRTLISPHTYREFYSMQRSSYGANVLSNYVIFNHYTADKEYLQELFQSLPDWARWREYRAMAERHPALYLITRIIEEINPARVYAERMLRRLKQNHPEQDESLQIKEVAVCKTEYELNLDYLLYLMQKHFSDTIITLPRIEKYLRLHIQTDNEEIPLSASEEDRKHRFKCMTVHKAKGLEFDYVVIPITEHQFITPYRSQVLLQKEGEQVKVGYQLHLNSITYRNNYFEQLYNQEKDELIAEETRLLYVAMTRARKGLYARLNDLWAPSEKINSWGDLIKGDKNGVQN